MERALNDRLLPLHEAAIGTHRTADDIAQAVVLAATNRNPTGTTMEADGGARLVYWADQLDDHGHRLQ